MRNKDNYKNAYDYIKHQLFPYDYNNPEHLHIIQLKLWTLDGPLLQEEINSGILDNNINVPKNHLDSFHNELNFLECYRKTKENKLSENELNFEQLVEQRKRILETWVKTINHETGEFYKDYELGYNSRPTLLSNEEFAELYTLWLTKGLENCFDISNKPLAVDMLARSVNIAIDTRNQELTILNYKTPDETKQLQLKNAQDFKNQRDDSIVQEMQLLHKQITEILLANKPEDFVPPNHDDEPEVRAAGSNFNSETGVTTTTTVTVSYSDINTLAVNLPAKRVLIGMNKEDSSHKGFIQETDQIHNGGYRFNVYKSDLISVYDMPTCYKGLPGNWIKSGISPYNNGAIEWTYKNFYWAWKYTRTVTTTITKSSSSSGSSYSSNRASDGSTTESISTTYFLRKTDWGTIASNNKILDEYEDRWYQFNEIREDQMKHTGLRIQIEALIDSNNEDLSSDLNNYFEVLKKEEMKVENILQEKCLFEEWK